MAFLVGIVAEDYLVEGFYGFVVRQAQQQLLPADAPCAEVVADELGEIEGVVGIAAEELVYGEIAGLHGDAVGAVDVVLEHVVLVGDVEADILGQLVQAVVAVRQGIEVESGAFYGDDFAGILQVVQVGEFYLVVESGEALHVGAPAQVGGVDEVLDAALQGGEGSAGAVVADAGVGMVGVDAEGKLLLGALGGDFLIVQGDAHGGVVGHEAGDALSAAFGHEGEAGEVLPEFILVVEVVLLGYEVVQQLLAQSVGQADFEHFLLSGAGGEGEAEERGGFGGEDGMVVQSLVVGQVDGLLQAVDGDALLRQGIAPEVAGVGHFQDEGVEGVAVVLVGGEAVDGVFGVVGGGDVAPRIVLVVTQLADAVASGLYGVEEDGADVYCAGIGVGVVEGTARQAPSQSGVLVLAGAEGEGDCNQAIE